MEIKVVMDSCGYRQAVIAPAFPEMGRRYRGFEVCATASVPPAAVADALRHKQRFVVADAESGDDLALIARTALGHRPTPLLVGSAGLAMRLAALLQPNRESRIPTEVLQNGVASAVPSRPSRRFSRKIGCGQPTLHRQAIDSRPFCETSVPTSKAATAGHVILFVGSTNPVTNAQVEHFSSIKTGGVVVYVPREQDAPDVSAFCKAKDVRGFLLCGGDTAEKVCRALGVRSIRLQGEVVTGLPWGWIEGGLADGLPVCTKAGGFGNEDALAVAADFLAHQPWSSRR